MRLHEDDSHIIEEQELRESLLNDAIECDRNDNLLFDAIVDMISASRDNLEFVYKELNSYEDMSKFNEKLIQREIDKRKEV